MRLILLTVLLLAACTDSPPPAPATGAPASDPAAESASLDALARDYVRLILELGELEPGYVDAYYGPPQWAEAARASRRDGAALTVVATELDAKLAAIAASSLDADSVQRRAWLRA